jgi:hypothetical protein
LILVYRLQYAITNSIIKVVANAKNSGVTNDGSQIDRPFVTSVINGKANDKLHKILRSGYINKIKPSKR